MAPGRIWLHVVFCLENATERLAVSVLVTSFFHVSFALSFPIFARGWADLWDGGEEEAMSACPLHRGSDL